MAIESVGSQTPIVQTSQKGEVDVARKVDERETSKVEEKDADQNERVRSEVQIKDSGRGASIDITG